jgi:aminomethyltransferase
MSGATDPSEPAAALRRTPLYEAHKALGARLVPFGGWEMPVQYPAGILKEHECVRTAVGLFDVSHMGEIVFRGARAGEAVQRLVTNAVGKLADGQAMYTVMCYPDGGIVDDCIVYRRGANEFLIIVNASNIAKDYAWMVENTGTVCDLANESDAHGLIAVQGPKAPALVSRLAPGSASLADTVKPFHFVQTSVAGVACMAARTGYTGEDGFELCCAAADTRKLWDALLAAGAADGVLPIGLGARDTLRLEARLSLYGNDIDQTTTPLEAGLGWVVKFDAGEWIGKAALQAQKDKGVGRKLIGFKVIGRGIARHDYPIYPAGHVLGGGADAPIGKVTSGTTAPSLGYAVGMGYVPAANAAPGGQLVVDCRGKPATVEIVSGPFYKRSK